MTRVGTGGKTKRKMIRIIETRAKQAHTNTKTNFFWISILHLNTSLTLCLMDRSVDIKIATLLRNVNISRYVAYRFAIVNTVI